ncbi:DENN domain-containing protein 1B, partial [Larimichthys crocea]
EYPERTFDLVLQVACPTSENEDPTVLWSFPQDHTDQEVLQTIPKFCFPFDVERYFRSVRWSEPGMESTTGCEWAAD